LIRESYQYLITEKNPIPFRPGMSASVDIQTRKVVNVVSIPIQAVTTRNPDSLNTENKNDLEDREISVKNENEDRDLKKEEVKIKEYVFINNNGISKQVEVKTGIQDNDYIEIMSGLSNNQEVICGPYSAVSKSLKEGLKIKIVKKEDLYKSEK
jgi:HlyD family secretion protein